MDNQNLNPYDRITVIIKNEELTARPIEFEYNDEGMPIKAIKWESVDPTNGQLIQFEENKIKWRDSIAIYDESIFPNAQIEVKDDSRQLLQEIDKCPFLDPIEIGVFV